jgi:uncharacterized protein YggE
MVLYSFNLFAQEYFGDNKLVLVGKSKLIIPSNRASFNYKIVEYGSSFREAVQKAKDKVATTVQILNKYGIHSSDISTSFFKSGENAGGGLFLSSKEDYKTFVEIFVIVDSLKILEETILALSEADINDIYNIHFSLHDIDRYEKNVRDLAIEDARNKAVEIAKGFGVKLLNVIYIEESNFRKNYPNPFNPSLDRTGDLEEIQLSGLYSKPIKLTDEVKVIFRID